jgi:hypothetical protein
MSAGSDASNLGYGNISPLSNVTGKFVNIDNSNSPATFGSNEISGSPPGLFGQGLAGAKNNIDAALGCAPGICLIKGGAKNIKRKIKNITIKYKMMKKGSKKMNSFKNLIKKRLFSTIKSKKNNIKKNSSKNRKNRKKRTLSKRKLRQRGGYSQYQNNLPLTPTYQVAGINLPASESALASPPPYRVLSNCVNCVDNYDHYTNKGFPSKGH